MNAKAFLISMKSEQFMNTVLCKSNESEIRPLFSQIFKEISNDISRSFFENLKNC